MPTSTTTNPTTATANPTAATPRRHCAIYTRKSTEEGLQQEFNSLDAQRESAEAYIKSQAHEGWSCLDDRYDDGGFSGGNMERPALQRLLADIEAGKVHTVVTYKVDRLTRSLLDFAKILETFDRHQVAFVSVTQQINSATSMGRLMLNVLLSFAQFEREIISERTRDKMAATRRKGKWCGGAPLLGYDLDPRGSKLLVNEAEARQVRAIFDLYLKQQALLPVVRELNRRGWTTKRWLNKAGQARGGRLFDRTNVYRLLTNVAYAGKVRYKNEVYDGEQLALVDLAQWERVQRLLRQHGHPGGGKVTDGFLLRGLLRCSACACAMTPSQTRRGSQRYRYYVCTHAQKRGWDQCPSKSLPAGPLENFVVEQLGRSFHDSSLHDSAPPLGQAQSSEPFHAVWPRLTPERQSHLLRRMLQGVAFDGVKQAIAITFHGNALDEWALEMITLEMPTPNPESSP
jgi:site-specific DNA recombinase